jgi:hypothetical protein
MTEGIECTTSSGWTRSRWPTSSSLVARLRGWGHGARRLSGSVWLLRDHQGVRIELPAASGRRPTGDRRDSARHCRRNHRQLHILGHPPSPYAPPQPRGTRGSSVSRASTRAFCRLSAPTLCCARFAPERRLRRNRLSVRCLRDRVFATPSLSASLRSPARRSRPPRRNSAGEPSSHAYNRCPFIAPFTRASAIDTGIRTSVS